MLPVLNTWSKIAEKVEKNQGVLTISMLELRLAYGARRLGSQVRANMSSSLAASGIKHIPVELPDNQDEVVRLYDRKSPVGRIIEASRRIGSKNDQFLRDAAAGEAQIVLEKVRELVCD